MRREEKAHDLEVRSEAISLVIDVYRIIVDFPRNEILPLTNQMRRQKISVPSNINALLLLRLTPHDHSTGATRTSAPNLG
ncbi:MAG: four helix bundle protein [Acidiferrobacterales bacterium]